MNIDYAEYDDSDQWAQIDNELWRQSETALLENDPGFTKWSDERDQDDRKHEMEINDDMSFDELVPTESDYLKKEDAGEGGLILTIAGFSRTTVGKGEDADERTVMHFTENVKPMVLNRTNAQLIPVVTGAKTSGAAKGKKIVVYNDPTVPFGNKIVGGLRIRSATGPVAAAPAAPDTGTDPNDGIPFAFAIMVPVLTAVAGIGYAAQGLIQV